MGPYSSKMAVQVVYTVQRKQFTGRLIQVDFDFLRYKQNDTTEYNPVNNGLTERINGVFLKAIPYYVDNNHWDRDDIIPQVTFSLNTIRHEVSKYILT